MDLIADAVDAAALAASATAEIADAVWAEPLPAPYAAGTAGYILGNWAGVTVTYVSPVVDDDEIEIYQGDDYYEADGRSLKWTEVGTTWPDITLASVVFCARSPAGDTFTKAGVMAVGGGGPGQQVYVELSAAETALLADWPAPSQFAVQIVLGGHTITLVSGVIKIIYDLV